MFPDRFIKIGIFIDANCLNSKGKLENMNILKKWYDNGVILMEFPEAAHKEAAYGNKFREIATRKYIYSCLDDTNDNPDESDLDAFNKENNLIENDKKREFQNILFPNGINENDPKKINKQNDVKNVFSAWSHGYIFVTNDGGSNRQHGGIIGNAKELKKAGVDVMRDADAVKLIKGKIKERDENVRNYAETFNKALPDWVGKD